MPRPPGSGIEFIPHLEHDRLQYSDLPDLVNRVETAGYYGGIRLLMVSDCGVTGVDGWMDARGGWATGSFSPCQTVQHPIIHLSPTHPHQAACKRFHQHCSARGRRLPQGLDDYSLSYSTNIPRQAGLSGSSAIACAALNCLFAHYGVPWEVRFGPG